MDTQDDIAADCQRSSNNPATVPSVAWTFFFPSLCMVYSSPYLFTYLHPCPNEHVSLFLLILNSVTLRHREEHLCLVTCGLPPLNRRAQIFQLSPDPHERS